MKKLTLIKKREHVKKYLNVDMKVIQHDDEMSDIILYNDTHILNLNANYRQHYNESYGESDINLEICLSNPNSANLKLLNIELEPDLMEDIMYHLNKEDGSLTNNKLQRILNILNEK